jgi:Mycotoxin biosynthesis protein UstYa
MCHADLTPLKIVYVDSAQRYIPDFATTHVCRDFESIFHWVKERRERHGEMGSETVVAPSYEESARLH